MSATVALPPPKALFSPLVTSATPPLSLSKTIALEVEVAFRSTFLEGKPCIPVEDAINILQPYLEFLNDTQHSTTHSHLPQTLANLHKIPYLLLSDVIATLPLDELISYSEKTFTNVSPLHPFLSGPSFKDGKLILLRLINSLLRRLSKISHNILAGQILLYLSSFFAVSERSGVNLKGEYRENSQRVVSKEDFNSNIESDKVINYDLYATLWNVLNLCHLQSVKAPFISECEKLVVGLESNNFSKAEAEVIREEWLKGKLGEEGEPPAEDFIGYLSKPSLISLLFRDPSVRLTILVQLLIALRRAPAVKDTKRLVDRVERLLKLAPPNGMEILRLVKMGRESRWEDWKGTGCKAFERDPVEEEKPAKRRKRLPAPMKEYSEGGWAGEDALRMKGEKPSDFVEFVDDFIEARDPEAGIEDEYNPKNDSVFCWRAQRLGGRRVEVLKEWEGGLEDFVQKIWKEEGKEWVEYEVPEEENNPMNESREVKDEEGGEEGKEGEASKMEVDGKISPDGTAAVRKNSITKFGEGGQTHTRFSDE
ncbi:hypothetical protein TrST_g9426 [Triparma strigata]|uniref:Uncharacterized protein n=1 Tax=Triparma strigata TaxID=1606541 RepID=A0A9W7AQS1_9STRA|nr:hypothetical protein TrST_g9426 [Triparma strigata]